MHALSELARFILDRMEPQRRYDASDLRAFAPDVSAEKLRDVMHELWINRQVERTGDAAWQRHRSAPPHAKPASTFRQTKVVKPEELFDHDAFNDFFR